jgi:NADH-quinone oxidoreductase subunit H
MTSSSQGLSHFLQTWWVEFVCAAVIIAVVPLVAGYIILLKRKLLTDLLERLGPKQVGLDGLRQLIADSFRLLMKRDIVPRDADMFVFWLAPIVTMAAAVTSLGALYCGPGFRVARDINIGILFVLGVSSLGFLGIILAGWATNKQSVRFSAMRSTAQFITYELAGGLAIVSALLLCGTLKIHAIVEAQAAQHVWFIFLAPAGFFMYLIAAIFGTNRGPFDPPEAEAGPVASSVPEYSGFRWSLYFLGEYANMIVFASIAATLFLGGWLRPFPNVHWLNWLDVLPAPLIAAAGAYSMRRAGKQPLKVQTWLLWTAAVVCFVAAIIVLVPWISAPVRFALPGLNGAFWFLSKISIYIYIFMCLRSTLPCFRFDELIHLGWYILIPLAIVNVLSLAIAMLFESDFGYRWLAMIVTNIFILAAAIVLVGLNDKRAAAASSVEPETSDSYAG